MKKLSISNHKSVMYENENARILVEYILSKTNAEIYVDADIIITETRALEIWNGAIKNDGDIYKSYLIPLHKANDFDFNMGKGDI